MQSRITSDNPYPIAAQAVGNSLSAKLNQVIREHYPEGEVHFMEVITVLRSLAYSYYRVLLHPELRDPE